MNVEQCIALQSRPHDLCCWVKRAEILGGIGYVNNVHLWSTIGIFERLCRHAGGRLGRAEQAEEREGGQVDLGRCPQRLPCCHQVGSLIGLIDSKLSPFFCQKIGWIYYLYQY